MCKADCDSSNKVMLELADKTFSYYYDIAKRIESKSNMLIVIIGILYTLSGGYITLTFNGSNIPFETFNIVLFLSITIAYSIAVIYLLLALKLQEYYLLLPTTFSDNNLKLKEEEMEVFFVKQYRDMITKIKIENEKKSNYYKIGLIATGLGTIASFVIIAIGFFTKGGLV